jgi:hypothetical protein
MALTYIGKRKAWVKHPWSMVFGGIQAVESLSMYNTLDIETAFSTFIVQYHHSLLPMTSFIFDGSNCSERLHGPQIQPSWFRNMVQQARGALRMLSLFNSLYSDILLSSISTVNR